MLLVRKPKIACKLKQHLGGTTFCALSKLLTLVKFLLPCASPVAYSVCYCYSNIFSNDECKQRVRKIINSVE